MTTPTPQILLLADLYALVPSRVINGYFNDAGTGVITDDLPSVQQTLAAAEGELYSRLRRSWQGWDAIKDLVNSDATLRMHLAWVACEYASERRPEFTDAQGLGAFQAQYNRAITYFDNISKGLQRSSGESASGVGANTGGQMTPKPYDPCTPPFVFSPSKFNPRGPGGF